jgi:hypothetical protein
MGSLVVIYGGKVALLPGQSAPEECLTLVHELSRNVAKRQPSLRIDRQHVWLLRNPRQAGTDTRLFFPWMPIP